MEEIIVTAAVITKSDRVLAARRKPGSHLAGFWEFPGGKIEANETPEDCLKKELKEELDISAEIGFLMGKTSMTTDQKSSV